MQNTFIDLTGKQFGRLTVIERAEDQVSPSGRHRAMWLCKCECGNTKVINGENLKGGKTLSCGCLHRQRAREAMLKHGDTDSRLYNVWSAIKRRCYKQDDPAYSWYGGRGVKMCEEWRNDYSAFREWALESGYRYDAKRGECTLDRVDNDGDYTPSNCRWVSMKEQANNKSTNHYIAFGDVTHTIAEWAEILDMPYSKLRKQLADCDFDIEKVIKAG